MGEKKQWEGKMQVKKDEKEKEIAKRTLAVSGKWQMMATVVTVTVETAAADNATTDGK